MAQRGTEPLERSRPPADARLRLRRGRADPPIVAARAIAVRPAVEPDAVCIAALGIQVFLDTYATDGIRGALAREAMGTLSPAAIGEQLRDAATTFLLAEVAGHLIGFAQLRARTAHALVPHPAPTELKRLYVQERFTGRGVGRALLRHAETAAMDTQASAIWLAAWSGNARALGFYASQGYVELASTRFVVEDEHYVNRLFAKSLRGDP